MIRDVQVIITNDTLSCPRFFVNMKGKFYSKLPLKGYCAPGQRLAACTGALR